MMVETSRIPPIHQRKLEIGRRIGRLVLRGIVMGCSLIISLEVLEGVQKRRTFTHIKINKPTNAAAGVTTGRVQTRTMRWRNSGNLGAPLVRLPLCSISEALRKAKIEVIMA